MAFLGLLAAVATLRGVELLISRRHEGVLEARGARKASDPSFPWMVMAHAGILTGAALEVVLLHRRWIPSLGLSMGTLFILANVIRWWVIRTLGNHWNIRVMNSTSLGVISGGPFRFVRHPNYAAVFIELAALPLIHTAWLTAVFGTAGHAWVLSRRLAVEDSLLIGSPEYRAVMAGKPRFVPRFFGDRLKSRSKPAALRQESE